MPKRLKKPPVKCKVCKDTGKVTKVSLRLPFNPASPGAEGDVGRLIKHFKLKMPVKRGEDRTTTESKYLKRFGNKYPIFKQILECREKSKIIGTYMWIPASDGRLHTSYGFHPSTLRKSSRGPNLQNIPKRVDLADEVRSVIVAAPGHVLVEADSAAIEAVISGVCMGSPAYIRLAKAGIHDFLTSHIVKQPVDPSLPFDELKARLKAIKSTFPEVRERAKRICHGSNYLLTPYGIYDEYEEDFTNRKEAAELQELYFGLFPEIRKWHHNTLELASRQTFLDSHYLTRHYYYSIYSWNKNTNSWGLGEDAKRAVAFVPQSDASCIQNLDLLELHKDPLVAPCLRLIIHDSFVLEVPLELVDYTCQRLHSIMSRPRPELGGESIGVEIAIGADLRKSAMDTWKPKEESKNEPQRTN